MRKLILSTFAISLLSTAANAMVIDGRRVSDNIVVAMAEPVTAAKAETEENTENGDESLVSADGIIQTVCGLTNANLSKGAKKICAGTAKKMPTMNKAGTKLKGPSAGEFNVIFANIEVFREAAK